MALKSTVCKAILNIADMDRHYYADHHLTVARHPSETDERMMVRILAFALNASEHLEFTAGLSADDEPDVWEKTLTGDVNHWIEVGLPEEDRIRKACNRAERVTIYGYGGRGLPVWWDKLGNRLQRHDNLRVVRLAQTETTELAAMADRSMNLQVNIEDQVVTISSDDGVVMVNPERLL